MRIAISGSHCTGKSTLVERLAAALPGYEVVEEPYYALEAEGHAFSHPPSLDDFLAQLDRSIESLHRGPPDVLFDRSPADFLAYVCALGHTDTLASEGWSSRVREAMGTLDFVVFVPIEARDRIASAVTDEERTLRARVDEILREILLDDCLALGLGALEATGSPQQRTELVLRRMREGG